MVSKNDTLVTVATAANELDGQILANILIQDGIRAVSSGGFTAQFRGEAPGIVRVLVAQTEWDKARAILTDCNQHAALVERPIPEKPTSDVQSPSGANRSFWILIILILAGFFVLIWMTR